ncbi:hypothetical protein PQH03_28460 [Ralstonia insidiosa]|jgi:hypothetical protein|uniref:hypothetical protein n=1 Tax=Ralstonia TaxID=48736 RepID=UPI001E2B287C|nr:MULTISPECIES: hypothetical protein [Ralstonia]MCK8652973.1 hypothetical protein [Ralstonia insidiosa]MDE4928583.1 hypothetical protein [Ralstonia insidiosa]UNK03983.1 hypothetical protein MMB19_29440 [Ralstonia insidiosa]
MIKKSALHLTAVLFCAIGASHAFAQGQAVIDNAVPANVSQARAVAAQMQPGSGPSGSLEAAQDAARTFMSLTTGVPSDKLTSTLQSAEADKAIVIVRAASANKYAQSCRYSLVKKPALNEFGWEITSTACSKG